MTHYFAATSRQSVNQAPHYVAPERDVKPPTPLYSALFALFYCF
jgi:hypothetical protein